MTDKTDSKEREAFEAWHLAQYPQHIARHGDTYKNAHVRCRWQAWQARASLAASAGREPAAEVMFADGKKYIQYTVPKELLPVGAKLYLHPSPPEGMVAEQALRKVLSVVQRYLPPDGPTAHDAMTEITEIVDPWPLGPLEKP